LAAQSFEFVDAGRGGPQGNGTTEHAEHAEHADGSGALLCQDQAIDLKPEHPLRAPDEFGSICLRVQRVLWFHFPFLLPAQPFESVDASRGWSQENGPQNTLMAAVGWRI
jgi:hypothetical protein